jgi:transposase
MAFEYVSDELWKEIKPLLPVEPAKPKGGRPRVSDRACLTGIVFVLRTGAPWRMIPAELGCGSGVTCWRRLREWTAAGVWPRVWKRLLRKLKAEGKLEPRMGIIGSQSVRAIFGGDTPAKTPQIAGKKGANAIS